MNTPTVDQLETLRGEAARANDFLQVDLCDRAIAGDKDALLECAIVIDDAEARQDD